MLVDLHCHSTASDGSLSPQDVVALAEDVGVGVLALTDHDTIDGVAEARAAGDELGVRVITGVELSVDSPHGHFDLLAYGFDPDHAELGRELRRIQEGRERRIGRTVAQLQDAGLSITEEDVRAQVTGTPGRPHVAQALVAIGAVETVQEAFDRYMADGLVGYVPKDRMTSEDAVRIIQDAGGFTSLAHPVFLKDHLLKPTYKHLVELGMGGIECWHSAMAPKHTKLFLEWARRDGLQPTGGSDFHGEAKPTIRLGIGDVERGGKKGNVRVPESIVQGVLAQCSEVGR